MPARMWVSKTANHSLANRVRPSPIVSKIARSRGFESSAGDVPCSLGDAASQLSPSLREGERARATDAGEARERSEREGPAGLRVLPRLGCGRLAALVPGHSTWVQLWAPGKHKDQDTDPGQ
jgi:hypothetical protein